MSLLFDMRRKKNRADFRGNSMSSPPGNWTSYYKALESDPRNPQIWTRFGMALHEQGYLNEAESAFRTAISCGGRAKDLPYLKLAQILHQQASRKVTANGVYEKLGWLEKRPATTVDSEFFLSVSKFTVFGGKLFVASQYRHLTKSIHSVYVVFSNGVFIMEVNVNRGILTVLDHCIDIPGDASSVMKLGFEFSDGSRFELDQPTSALNERENGNDVILKFTQLVQSFESGNILEIGSRARSGNTYKWFLPEGCKYVGFDIKEGENVDVTGDAHQLSDHFEKRHFDAVYSISTFEHLLMPWKVAVEMNRVMKLGAIGFVGSHQAWPLHEEPWDFWRFSNTSWNAIFNKLTGFEIIEVGLVDRARIAPVNFNHVTYRLDETFAYLHSNVLFRKVGESVLDWPATASQVIDSDYPL